MKLINEDGTEFYISESRLSIVDYGSDFQKIFNSMYLYFENKKGSNCNVLDVENDVIEKKDISVIYVDGNDLTSGLIQGNSKSVLKNYLEEVMLNNDMMFINVYKALENLRSSFTDIGFIKLKEKLLNGIERKTNFIKEDINLTNISQILKLDLNDYSKTEILLMYLNIIIESNKDKKIYIILGNIVLDDTVIDWLKIKQENLSLIIDNKSIEDIHIFESIDLEIIKQNNDSYIEEISLSNTFKLDYLYSIMQTTRKNINFQSEKIKKLCNIYSEKHQNFKLTFYSSHR